MSYWRGKLSTVTFFYLPTSLYQFLYYWKYYLHFYQTTTIMRRSTVLSHPLQLVFPGRTLFALMQFMQSVLKLIVILPRVVAPVTMILGAFLNGYKFSQLFYSLVYNWDHEQGILTEREGSVQLTSWFRKHVL